MMSLVIQITKIDIVRFLKDSAYIKWRFVGMYVGFLRYLISNVPIGIDPISVD
ncbi:hypothetical protein BCAR13_760041 [Paraburkholderia caribensis]|jgi:hypothetical protein|nr:hypothetical protein BCAR13_760041 [Paraburkholderia caribensis]